MFQMTFEGLLENDVPEQELEVDEKKKKKQPGDLFEDGRDSGSGRETCVWRWLQVW